MTAPFYLSGTEPQRQIVRDALAACDFPFPWMMPSLQREGRSTIRVEWADLSRYARGLAEHSHVDGAHTIVREVDGRMRVLGLFYLPPHTRIVLDLSLESMPQLGMEVPIAEVAHAVDYHYMTPEMRRAFVNSVHTEQLPPGANVSDKVRFELDGHVCSWFDVGVYADWVGEAFMEGFIEAYAPSIPVTINLNHPVGPEDVAVIRNALTPAASLPEPTVEPAPEAPVPPVEYEVYALTLGETYHDKHKGIARERTFSGATEAQEAGYRPCRVCKPGR